MSNTESTPNPFESPAEAGTGGEYSSETGKLVYMTIKFGGGALLLLIVLQLFNILGITYRYRVENEPLKNPVRVVRNNNDELELADGRVITNYWDNDRLAEVMKRTGSDDVEIARSELGPDQVDVYAKDHHFFCGIGDPMFTIPLIPLSVPRYKRVMVGYGDRSQDALRTTTSTP